MTSLRATFLSLILSLPALLIALTVHEFAHGYAAYKMGDYTAKYSGRLSLNPLAHFDLVGTLCLLVFHFGWAKPVPINPNNFKNQKKGIIIVSLAGPFANFVCALLFSVVFVLVQKFMPVSPYLYSFVINIIYYCIALNIGLMVFNLIPIPPLDGSKVLLELLPPRAKMNFYRYERYSFLILMLLLFTGILTPVLTTLQSGVLSVINALLNLIF